MGLLLWSISKDRYRFQDHPKLEGSCSFSKVGFFRLRAQLFSKLKPLECIFVLVLLKVGDTHVETTSIVVRIIPQALEVKVKSLVDLFLSRHQMALGFATYCVTTSVGLVPLQ